MIISLHDANLRFEAVAIDNGTAIIDAITVHNRLKLKAETSPTQLYCCHHALPSPLLLHHIDKLNANCRRWSNNFDQCAEDVICCSYHVVTCFSILLLLAVKMTVNIPLFLLKALFL